MTPDIRTPQCIPRILPRRTRVVDAVAQAAEQGAGLWLTDRGQVVIHPQGRPGWLRLPYRAQEPGTCAA